MTMFIILAAVAMTAIVSTVLVTARDGYARIPARRA